MSPSQDLLVFITTSTSAFSVAPYPEELGNSEPEASARGVAWGCAGGWWRERGERVECGEREPCRAVSPVSPES